MVLWQRNGFLKAFTRSAQTVNVQYKNKKEILKYDTVKILNSKAQITNTSSTPLHTRAKNWSYVIYHFLIKQIILLTWNKTLFGIKYLKALLLSLKFGNWIYNPH